MIDKFKKYLGLHGWMLRSAYIGALVAFGIVCFQFYVGQTSENERTDAYRHMSDSFAIVDEKFRIFFDKANSIIKNYEAAQRLTAASPLSQNQEVDTDAPGGLDIETSKNVLKFFVEIAGEAFDEVLVAWHHAGEQDSASLFADSLFIPSENPFRSYHDLLSLERIDTVKTQKELYLAAGQIVFIFEKMVSPVSVDLQNRLRIMLAERAELQGKRLENFLLIALGMLAGIAVFVFLPVDVILQRMLKSLSIEKERANEAIASLETEATVRKQQEIELIKHRDQLQQLVDDATAELRFKAEELEQALTKEKSA